MVSYRRTIRELNDEGELPLVARFGKAHSLLSRELRKEGIESSREIEAGIFDWNVIVERKLLTGKKPSDLEYKKGLLSVIAQDMRLVIGKDLTKINASDASFFNLLQTTMINRLPERQIEKLIQDAARDLSRHNGNFSMGVLLTTGMLMRLNGFSRPERTTRKELEEFLKKYSPFWRRMQRAKERQKASKQK